MDVLAPNAISIIGDIHGQFELLLGLLLNAGLVGTDLAWAGGNAVLWLIGDLLDRGPDGIAVVDLVMRLQGEASGAGGKVGVVLGNHEVMILAAQHFGGHFLSEWEWNGGNTADLVQLTSQHIAWMTSLPAMVAVGDRLLVHADATFYARYGRSVAQTNRAIGAMLASHDRAAWERLLDGFSERRAFGRSRLNGVMQARQFLRTFGARQLIHGHTPISAMCSLSPEDVTAPFVYADGLCVNIDGGMYLGGPGFVYQIT